LAKRCLSCKRDIAEGQKSCFVCGSSQSLIAHYSGSGLLILLVMLIAAAASYWYIGQVNQEFEANLIKLKVAQQQIQQAESTATEALNQLKQVQQQAEQASKNVEANDQLNAETQAKITAAEKKAEDAQKNVNWLAKQNNQLKTQVQDLTEQLSNTQRHAQSEDELLTEAQAAQRVDQARQADALVIQDLRLQLQNVQQQLAALQTGDN
jgi:chromosome segregation ATPase